MPVRVTITAATAREQQSDRVVHDGAVRINVEEGNLLLHAPSPGSGRVGAVLAAYAPGQWRAAEIVTDKT